METIYEDDYEEDDDDDDDDDEDNGDVDWWGSWPAFEWPERSLLESDEEEGMIEIPLALEEEEDNLIEIDISACKSLNSNE